MFIFLTVEVSLPEKKCYISVFSKELFAKALKVLSHYVFKISTLKLKLYSIIFHQEIHWYSCDKNKSCEKNTADAEVSLEGSGYNTGYRKIDKFVILFPYVNKWEILKQIEQWEKTKINIWIIDMVNKV